MPEGGSENVGGRPPEDLQARLQRAIGFWPDFSDWPQTTSPCWPGPKLIWFEGRMMPTRRACLSHIFGTAMHRSWRVRATCTSADCINPHHARLEPINRLDGSPVEPLPLAAHAQHTIHDASNDVEDCADWIAMIEGQDMPLDDLVARCNGAYSRDVVIAAKARARDL